MSKKKIYIIVMILAALILAAALYIKGSPGHNIICPVLTYHRLTSDLSMTSDWTTSPQKFEEDLCKLLDNGYTPIFTSELVLKDKPENFPDKPVIIQFDDGYNSVYELAFPILKKYNAKAEIYIITDYTEDMPREQNGNTFIGWQQLEEMEKSGLMYTGVHGKTHLPVVENYTDEEIKNNFIAAWEAIEERLGPRPHYYVYPQGRFNKKTVKLTKQAGCDEQFVWIWDMNWKLKNYVLGRINIGYKTDVIKSIEWYNKTRKQKIKF
ncbi:poly-beta-1,6-N-acetyl-D-glucosamine N-deacetylase [Clostridiales bacterium]|nr:poly-beta-1,6-N-acetyl-D-glucosamine N-deacetylase [Clostridiales bacterium]